MMDGFEGVVKVGGYIIFFSIIIALFRKAAGRTSGISGCSASP